MSMFNITKWVIRICEMFRWWSVCRNPFSDSYEGSNNWWNIWNCTEFSTILIRNLFSSYTIVFIVVKWNENLVAFRIITIQRALSKLNTSIKDVAHCCTTWIIYRSRSFSLVNRRFICCRIVCGFFSSYSSLWKREVLRIYQLIMIRIKSVTILINFFFILWEIINHMQWLQSRIYFLFYVSYVYISHFENITTFFQFCCSTKLHFE